MYIVFSVYVSMFSIWARLLKFSCCCCCSPDLSTYWMEYDRALLHLQMCPHVTWRAVLVFAFRIVGSRPPSMDLKPNLSRPMFVIAMTEYVLMIQLNRVEFASIFISMEVGRWLGATTFFYVQRPNNPNSPYNTIAPSGGANRFLYQANDSPVPLPFPPSHLSIYIYTHIIKVFQSNQLINIWTLIKQMSNVTSN